MRPEQIEIHIQNAAKTYDNDELEDAREKLSESEATRHLPGLLRATAAAIRRYVGQHHREHVEKRLTDLERRLDKMETRTAGEE